jgi:hypothetical protein
LSAEIAQESAPEGVEHEVGGWPLLNRSRRVWEHGFASQITGVGLMALSAKDFYRSSNGDRWQLIRDTTLGRSFVRHEPNLSSGGRVTDTEVDEFLARTGSSPENLALRALLDKRQAPAPR